MTILSDTDIRSRMAEGELVIGGEPSRAEQCSYSFVPGRVFLAGRDDSPVDFSQPEPAEVLVGPGEMIWVRTLEQVKLPRDLAGFWWQTNTLSREGLMLVNMSMVEPGYEGPLACLFVNFGKDRVPISATTKVAKMIFTAISSEVTVPFTKKIDLDAYDADLRKLALGHPNTFLQVADLVAGLREERTIAISEIQIEGQKVKKSAESDLDAMKLKALGEFQADTWKSTLKSIGAAALALAIFTAALAFHSWLKGEFTPDIKSVARAEAEKVLDERIVVSGTPELRESTNSQLDGPDRRPLQVEKGR